MKVSDCLSTEKHREFWSQSAEAYFGDLYAHVREYPSLILRHRYILELLDGRSNRIIDIGCGPGEMVSDLAKRGHTVYGMDIAAGMLRVASENYVRQRGSRSSIFQCGDIEALPFRDKAFDGIICAGVIEYLPSDRKALAELNRILKLEGALIITVRNKACPFRVLDWITDRIKSSTYGLKSLNRIRIRLGKEPTRFISYRKHFPWKLDRKLYNHGFRKVGFRYFHFYPFFVPMDKILPSFFIRTGLRMERLSGKTLGILGSGYIVKSIKFRDL